MPPPNVTGKLHMGHVLNNTVQDILVRKARMEGNEVCWVAGIDHASIATEAKVVAHLKAQGIGKKSLSRKAFLEHAWAWKKKYGGIIIEQLKMLGVSCDWSRTTFTLDTHFKTSVDQAFVELYRKGYIYRDSSMIHWDPQGETVLSDEEIVYKPVKGQLYYIRYNLMGVAGGSITVATTRPETLFGDVAICLHPKDKRYEHLIGQTALLPLIPISAAS